MPWLEVAVAAIAALVGAAAAAVPAYILAQRASREVLERDRIQRREQEKAAAFRAFTKILLLSNSVLTIEKQIEGMARRPSGPDAPLARRISALAGLSEREVVFFDADELAIFSAAGRIDYVNELQLLSRQQLAIVEALITYKDHKVLAQQILDDAAFEEMEGGAVRYRLTDEETRRLRAQEVHLESLIVPLRKHIEETAQLSRRLAAEFGPIVQEYFKCDKMPTIVDGEPAAATENAASPLDETSSKSV